MRVLRPESVGQGLVDQPAPFEEVEHPTGQPPDILGCCLDCVPLPVVLVDFLSLLEVGNFLLIAGATRELAGEVTSIRLLGIGTGRLRISLLRPQDIYVLPGHQVAIKLFLRDSGLIQLLDRAVLDVLRHVDLGPVAEVEPLQLREQHLSGETHPGLLQELTGQVILESLKLA